MIKKIKNMQAFNQVGITAEEFMEWCKLNNIPYNKSDSKRKFFDDLRSGTIRIEDSKIIQEGE